MTPFFIALQFLTTFPIQLKAMPSKQQNGQSLLFYPVVGLIIGGILALIAFTLQSLPIILLSSIVLVLWIWLTGGLHLDGLADTADAWVGGFGDTRTYLKNYERPSLWPDWCAESSHYLLVKMVGHLCITAKAAVFGVDIISNFRQARSAVSISHHPICS